jgi:hypothetical protein
MELFCETLVSAIAMKQGSIKTIRLRIPIFILGDENAQWDAFDQWQVYKSSRPFMLQFSTNLATNVIF